MSSSKPHTDCRTLHPSSKSFRLQHKTVASKADLRRTTACSCLQRHMTLLLHLKICIYSTIVEREKTSWVQDFLFDTDYSSLQLYRTVYKADHSVCQYFEHLSTVRCYTHRRSISRFKCGCHGLHVDTGCFGTGSAYHSREDRVCLVCMSGSVEDKHHFLFDCPTYSHIRQQYSHLFHQASPSVEIFLATDHPNVVGNQDLLCSKTICFGQSTFGLASEHCRARLV